MKAMRMRKCLVIALATLFVSSYSVPAFAMDANGNAETSTSENSSSNDINSQPDDEDNQVASTSSVESLDNNTTSGSSDENQSEPSEDTSVSSESSDSVESSNSNHAVGLKSSFDINQISYPIIQDGTQISTINLKKSNDDLYLFLPSHVDVSALTLQFGDLMGKDIEVKGTGSNALNTSLSFKAGESIDLNALYQAAPSDHIYPVVFKIDDKEYALNIMTSGGVSALFLDIDENMGTIEAMNASKGVNCFGQANIITEDATLESLGSMSMKGRGPMYGNMKEMEQMHSNGDLNRLVEVIII